MALASYLIPFSLECARPVGVKVVARSQSEGETEAECRLAPWLMARGSSRTSLVTGGHRGLRRRQWPAAPPLGAGQ